MIGSAEQDKGSDDVSLDLPPVSTGEHRNPISSRNGGGRYPTHSAKTDQAEISRQAVLLSASEMERIRHLIKVRQAGLEWARVSYMYAHSGLNNEMTTS